jgi:uncharacterized membrane protein
MFQLLHSILVITGLFIISYGSYLTQASFSPGPIKQQKRDRRDGILLIFMGIFAIIMCEIYFAYYYGKSTVK